MSDKPADDERIRHALATITTSWPDMLTIMPRRNLGPMVSTVAGSKPPANIVVLSTRRYVCERLASWCRLVMDDASDTGTIALYGDDAPGMCAFLGRWADFLAAHEAGTDAVAELEHDARTCEAIALDTRKRKFEVGRCIGHTETDMAERVPCAGTLSAVLSNDQGLLPLLHCDTDPTHVWDGSQWGEISRMPVTVEDAARITRIPARTIRQWLSDGEVSAVVADRPALVRLSDVTRRSREKAGA